MGNAVETVWIGEIGSAANASSQLDNLIFSGQGW